MINRTLPISLLNKREKAILECLVQGLHAVEITYLLGLKEYQVKYSITNLKEKYQAKTNPHLILLSIQNTTLFHLFWNRSSNVCKSSITYNEVQVNKLCLMGERNKEIAVKTLLSQRSVQLYKQMFRKKTKSENDADFVKGAILNGMLSIVPRSVEFGKNPIFENTILKITPNKYGSIFIDPFNRFHIDIPFRNRAQNTLFYDLRILGVILSEVPENILIQAQIVEIEDLLICIRTWNRLSEKVGNVKFIKNMISGGVLVIEKGVKRNRKINDPVPMLLIDYLMKESENNLKISKDQLQDLIEESFVAFDCNTFLTFIIESMSRGLISSKV